MAGVFQAWSTQEAYEALARTRATYERGRLRLRQVEALPANIERAADRALALTALRLAIRAYPAKALRTAEDALLGYGAELSGVAWAVVAVALAITVAWTATMIAANNIADDLLEWWKRQPGAGRRLPGDDPVSWGVIAAAGAVGLVAVAWTVSTMSKRRRKRRR